MTLLSAIRDPNPTTRREAVQRTEEAIRRTGGFRVHSQAAGPVVVVWGAPPSTPVDRAHLGDRFALVIGDAIEGGRSQRVTAQAYLEHPPHTSPPALDGFHVAASIDREGAITIAVDPLGIFPIYYFSAGDVLLATSGVDLLRAHVAFSAALDPVGLTGVLLANAPVSGRTPIRGVRRLAAGHCLLARSREKPQELERFRLQASDRLHGHALGKCADALYGALRDAVERHVTPDPHVQLLSGGLDSRLLAGLLHERGTSVSALTMGRPDDFDFRCARRVARRLSFPHESFDPEAGGWEAFVRNVWSRGLSTCPEPFAPGARGREVGRFGMRVVSGYTMDAIVGGTNIEPSYDPATGESGFWPYFGAINRWGVAPALLRKLLRSEVFGDSVDQVLHAIEREFRESGQAPLDAAWVFNLRNRQRISVARSVIDDAFGAWPRLPHTDRAVLETAGSIPLALLAGRRIEREILIAHHRPLARLPLDRASFDTTPLDPRLHQRVVGAFATRVARARHSLSPRTRERRFYYRSYDLDGSRWRRVRVAAEAHRERAYALFDRETFDALVPPAAAISRVRGLAASAKVKTLLGVIALLASLD